jgi:hypothetical protein
MKKVSIIGTDMGWAEAPEDGDAWGINDVIKFRPVTRIISSDLLDDCTVMDAKQLAEESNTPFICQDNYPLKEIIEKFGVDYFSNTIAYAIALAIYEGYEEIDLYGINMYNPLEATHEKDGIDFWCGFAKGRGIKVTVHGVRSQVMRTKSGLLYGFGHPQGLTHLYL